MKMMYTLRGITLTLLLANGFTASAGEPQDTAYTSQQVDTALKSVRGFRSKEILGRTDDGEFIRRVTKDLIGRAPTSAEVKAFSEDVDPGKRAKKIDRLLASDDFAAFWARRFTDVFFVSPRPGLKSWRLERYTGGYEKLETRFATWLEKEFARDCGWDKIVQEIISAKGKTDENPALGYQVSFYQTGTFPVEFAKGIARHFLGVRMRCAECHDHPFDQWRVEDVYGLASFAKEVKATPQGPNRSEVLVEWISSQRELQIEKSPDANDKASKVKLAQGGNAVPRFMFGGTAKDGEFRMETLAHYVTMKVNSQFPRAFVNRVWEWLMGRAFVHPADDFNMRNRAFSKSTLELLARDTMKRQYSLKQLVRVICNTEAYQRKDFAKVPEGAEVILRGAVIRQPYVRKAPRKEGVEITYTLPSTWALQQTVALSAQRRFPYLSSVLRRYRVPDKEGKTRDARLLVAKASPAQAKRNDSRTAGHLFYSKTKTLGTEWPVVTEITGLYPCDAQVDGFANLRMFSGTVLVGDTWYYFRLIGPSEAVSDWKEEFATALKSVRPHRE